MRGPILSAVHLGAHSIVRALVANSIIRPQTGGGREPDEWRTRDPLPVPQRWHTQHSQAVASRPLCARWFSLVGEFADR